MSDDVTVPVSMLGWLWSVLSVAVGGAVGGGVVYGTVRTKLVGLEERLEAVEARQEKDAEAMHVDISAMRMELKGDIRAMGDDLKGYMRDMLGRGK